MSPKPAEPVSNQETRTSLTPEAIARSLMDNLRYLQGRVPLTASRNDWYMALAFTIRDRVLQRWMATTKAYMTQNVKSVSYLSAEFLMGPHLGNALLNLGILEQTRQAVASLGQDLDDLLDQEDEPGLGSGGMGRLAACFLDSLATLEFLAVGYGIRYEFGIFRQEIHDGWQVEVADKWLRLGNPWELPRPEISFDVNLGGYTEPYYDSNGRYCVRWVPSRVIRGVAYDTPVPGYKVNTVNLLRLWKAEATESFDLRAFNVGDYYRAVEDKVASENVTKVLYPNDEAVRGKQLRLEQQYFLASCSLQDMIRVHLRRGHQPEDFHRSFAVQLNDTHPSVSVAELMRLLVDDHMMEWDAAWNITLHTFGYTNHTLLPEALEKWPISLFSRLLPRHFEIVCEINRRFIDNLRKDYPGDESRVARLSLLDGGADPCFRMAHLAAVGSHAINGVSSMHTELLERDVLRDLYEVFPERFLSITNGVTPRRWLLLSNPGLAGVICRRIGEGWISHANGLANLEPHAGDSEFQQEWGRAKRHNKVRLSRIIRERTGLSVDPDSLFDIQAKRIHEYKRQHLNVLHVVTMYHRIKKKPAARMTPRTVIFGGKAAPGYAMAKLMIKLITAVADVVNKDPDVKDRLKVVFLPDFNVKMAQNIYPAADLSEQISTAGKEASGTGNMKFCLNGALTIGTLDGANAEILEEVGTENFFLFGLTAGEIGGLKARGYDPMDYYRRNAQLQEVIDLIAGGTFSKGDRELFRPLVESLLSRDSYMLLADYQSYIDAQDRVSAAFRDTHRWTRLSIQTVARTGKFSSDRSILEYCHKIWNLQPLKIQIVD